MPGLRGKVDQAAAACLVAHQRLTIQASLELAWQHTPCCLGTHMTWHIPRSQFHGHVPIDLLATRATRWGAYVIYHCAISDETDESVLW